MFHTLFYQPIFNLLIYIYNILPGHDLGVAIIALTLIVRLLLYPLSKKSIQYQKELQEINPEIERIKEKHKDDKEKMGPELMKLYKDKKVNPFSSCLPMLIQLPFLFAIYRVFWNGLNNDSSMDALYSFVQNPGTLNTMAFGFFDLSTPSIFLAVLAGAAQFWQSRMIMGKKKNAPAQSGMGGMQSQMMYVMPIITVVIGSRFPAGLTFYWLLTTLFSVAQQYVVLGFGNKKDEIEVVDSK